VVVGVLFAGALGVVLGVQGVAVRQGGVVRRFGVVACFVRAGGVLVVSGGVLEVGACGGVVLRGGVLGHENSSRVGKLLKMLGKTWIVPTPRVSACKMNPTWSRALEELHASLSLRSPSVGLGADSSRFGKAQLHQCQFNKVKLEPFSGWSIIRVG